MELCDLRAPETDDLFRMLADPTRRAIFETLCIDGEQTVGALTARARVSQPAVSKHLAMLRRSGLVENRQQGREAHYSARPDRLVPLAAWTTRMSSYWKGRFDALENLLDRMDQ